MTIERLHQPDYTSNPDAIWRTFLEQARGFRLIALAAQGRLSFNALSDSEVQGFRALADGLIAQGVEPEDVNHEIAANANAMAKAHARLARRLSRRARRHLPPPPSFIRAAARVYARAPGRARRRRAAQRLSRFASSASASGDPPPPPRTTAGRGGEHGPGGAS